MGVSDPQKSQLNIYLPKELHRLVKATANRNGLALNEYCLKVLRAAVDSDALAQASPSFLERWEKFLQQFLKKQ